MPRSRPVAPAPPVGVTLRDGRHVVVRALTSADGAALQAAVDHADTDDLRRRFMGAPPPISVLLRRLREADQVHDLGLGAFDDHGRLVAVAQFDRVNDEPVAEIAIEVAADWQRCGLGRRMLDRLAENARAVGVRRFTARFYADNVPIRRLLQDSRKVVASGFDQGEGYAVLDLDR